MLLCKILEGGIGSKAIEFFFNRKSFIKCDVIDINYFFIS